MTNADLSLIITSTSKLLTKIPRDSDRYFEVKVTGCKNCPNKSQADYWGGVCGLKYRTITDTSQVANSIYKQNKDQLTNTCPMFNQTKESETIFAAEEVKK